MDPYQQDYESAYSPYRAFQGSGNQWVDMAVGQFLNPRRGPGDPIGGAIRGTYGSTREQFSDYRRDEVFNQMFAQGAREMVMDSATGRPRSNIFMDTLTRVQQGTGQQPVTDQQIQAFAGLASTLGGSLWGFGQNAGVRAIMDGVSLGANPMNAAMAIGFNHRSSYDPVTGGNRLTAETGTEIANAAFRHLFGNDPNKPNTANFFGSGAADMVPISNYLAQRGRLDLGLENRVLTPEMLGDLVSENQGSRPGTGRNTRDRLLSMGFQAEALDNIIAQQLENPGQPVDPKLLTASSGARAGEEMKSTRNLMSAIQSMLEPAFLKDAAATLQKVAEFNQQFGHQFSDNRQAEMIRQSHGALADFGYGFKQMQAYFNYAEEASQRAGYAGSMGASFVAQQASHGAALRRGHMSAQAYGSKTITQLEAIEMQDRLGYGRSYAGNLGAAMEIYAAGGASFDGADGARVQKIFENLRSTGQSGDDGWDQMTADERFALVTSATSDPDAARRIMSLSSNQTRIDDYRANNPNSTNQVKDDMRRHFGVQSRMAAAQEMVGGVFANMDTATVDRIGDLLGTEMLASDQSSWTSIEAGGAAVADAIWGKLSAAERAQLGSTEEEQRRNLTELARDHAGRVGESTGLAPIDTVRLLGDRTLRDANQERARAQARAEVEKLSTLTSPHDAADLLSNMSNYLNSTEEGKVTIEGLVQATLGSGGPQDPETRKKLARQIEELYKTRQRYSEEDKAARASGDTDASAFTTQRLETLDGYINDYEQALEAKKKEAEEAQKKAEEQGTAAPAAGEAVPSGTGESYGNVVFNNLQLNFPNDVSITVGQVKSNRSAPKEVA